jgi:hypothetical protein
VHRHVVGELVARAGHLDQDPVDATAALYVLVVPEHVAVAGVEAYDVAELDLLLQRDLELVELGRALRDRVGTLRRRRDRRAGSPRP